MPMEKIETPLENTVSGVTTLRNEIYVFVDPETREVQTIIGVGPFGTSEFNKDENRYVSLDASDTYKVRSLFNDYVKYLVDWKNTLAFDKNDKSMVFSKFVDGTLNEEWLKQNTIFVGDVLKKEE
jgi:hypothetical protein